MSAEGAESGDSDLRLEFGAGFDPDDVDRFLEILSDGGIRTENIDARHGGPSGD